MKEEVEKRHGELIKMSRKRKTGEARKTGFGEKGKGKGQGRRKKRGGD